MTDTQPETPAPSDSFNQRVGALLRRLRLFRGLGQKELGARLGISFQQIQKYENGLNGMSAERIAEISEVLEIDPGHFYQVEQHAGAYGVSAAKQEPLEDFPPAHKTPKKPDLNDVLDRKDTMELLRLWSEISDADNREMILKLAKSYSQSTCKT